MSKNKIQMQRTRAHGKAGLALSEAVGQPAPAPSGATKKILVSLPVTDVVWLSKQAEQSPRQLGVRLSKSEIVRVALELVRKEGGLARVVEIVRPKDI